MLHLAATLPALFHCYCSQEAGITPIMSLVLVESEHSVRYPLFISRAIFRTDIGYFGRHEEKVKNPEIRKPT